MIEEIYFQDEGHVRITAASVGISKFRWTSIHEEEIESNIHFKLMANNRFDHLPIVPASGTITEYFKTVEPNKFDKIERHQIKFNDVIQLDTNIRAVIEKFAKEKRNFFFLHFQRNIAGLITLGNLNCKQVQIYIFSLICELERAMGEYLNLCLTNDEIKKWLENKADTSNQNNNYKQILKNYFRLIQIDLENQLTEHFFLLNLFEIIGDKKLFKKLDYSESEWYDLFKINKLRNRIAHPSKSLLEKDNGINNLLECIEIIEDLTFRISIKLRISSSQQLLAGI